MKYLIDTHILLWWLNDDKRLSDKVKSIISQQKVWVSTAAAWEIVIKSQLGKLEIPGPIDEAIKANGFLLLDISLNHVMQLEVLPQIHSDPFDRIQIAQAKEDDMAFITADKIISTYPNVQIIEV